MSHRAPARSTARRTRSTALVGGLAGLACLLAATAFAAAPRLLNGRDSTSLSPNRPPGRGPATHAPGDAQPAASPDELPAPIAWPGRGQAAYVLGAAQPAASPTSCRPRSPAWPR